jgi:hypothetical protein
MVNMYLKDLILLSEANTRKGNPNLLEAGVHLIFNFSFKNLSLLFIRYSEVYSWRWETWTR